MVVLRLMGRDLENLKILDLFSGIGGFSLGLERTGGFETAAFCEIEPFPRKVLKKHWPEVPCYEDVRELTADQLVRDGAGSIDVITGGFPCQDLSSSGSGLGLNGSRSGLWSEIARLIGEIRPRYVLLENSPNLLTGANGEWARIVFGRLASLGYDAEWDVIGADEVGAPHKRKRAWIVAYPDVIGQSLPRGLLHAINPAPDAYREANHVVELFRRGKLPFLCERHDGVPAQVGRDQLTAFGNAVVPQIPEMIGRAILEAERSLGRR